MCDKLRLYKFPSPLKLSCLFQHSGTLGHLKELSGEFGTVLLACRASAVSWDVVFVKWIYVFLAVEGKMKFLVHVVVVTTGAVLLRSSMTRVAVWSSLVCSCHWVL